MDFLRFIGDTLHLSYLILSLGIIVMLIAENRNPVKTIAWTLVLVFIPYLGVALYVFFGQNIRKRHIINKRSYSRITQAPISSLIKHAQANVPEAYEGLVNFFKKTEKSLPYAHNDIQVFYSGKEMLAALVKMLYSACDHIHMEYYIFADDATGRLVRDILIDKAREGVKVRLAVDDVGSWKTKKEFFKSMETEGIEVAMFYPVTLAFVSNKTNYRNHKKVVVVDGKCGLVGGMNIADRYVKGTDWGNWRDTHLRIEGYAVRELQTNFLLDWFFATKKMVNNERYFPACGTSGEAMVQIASSEPFSRWKRIMQGLVFAITTSERYFYIQTPYFLPTEPILCAMQAAALAGVDVRLMIPAVSDSKMTAMASRSYLKQVLTAGVKVYMYKAGFLHSKMMVSDDMLCTVGSTNMDFRSFEQNFEINAFIFNENVAAQMKNQFLEDQRHSVRITLHKWNRRPWTDKMVESIVRVFSPLL